MKGGIDKDFYCSTAGMDDCPNKGDCGDCPDRHRKWPTPEQFREEYGEEYHDDGAVYAVCGEPCPSGKGFQCSAWTSYEGASHALSSYRSCGKNKRNPFIVCACTHWGKPPENWRPE